METPGKKMERLGKSNDNLINKFPEFPKMHPLIAILV